MMCCKRCGVFKRFSCGSLALSIALVMALGMATPTRADDIGTKFRSSGRLFGASFQARMRFEEQVRNGQLLRLLRIDVDHAPPIVTLPIVVNGRLLAFVTTNCAGRARLNMRSMPFFNDVNDGIPLPADFPTLRTGSMVSVGPAGWIHVRSAWRQWNSQSTPRSDDCGTG